MKQKIMASIFLVLFYVCFCTANAQEDAKKQKAKEKAQICVACHGPDGNSTVTIWPKLAGQHAKYLAKELRDYKQGEKGSRYVPTMYSFAASLSDEDIDLLADYYAAQTISVGYAKASLVALGSKIYRGGNSRDGVTACIACHGPAGEGNEQAGFPRLSGQHAEYIVAQLNAYKSGQRRNDLHGIMRDITAKMTPQEMEAVASYIEGLY